MVHLFATLSYNIDAMKQHYAIIISGPSGVGKGTVIQMVKDKYPNIPLSTSHTTRSPRDEEIDGVDYYFVSREEFNRLVANNEFIEWEEVHDNLYGTHTLNITKTENTDLLFEIDVKGAVNLMNRIREQKGNCISIFLDAPCKDDLIKRLKGRGSETEESINIRMMTADQELLNKKYFDYIVVNDRIDSAFQNIEDILKTKGVL